MGGVEALVVPDLVVPGLHVDRDQFADVRRRLHRRTDAPLVKLGPAALDLFAA